MSDEETACNINDESKLLSLDIAQVSDIGGRASNQDHLGILQQDEITCLVLSDGVGGELGGEVASHIVVESILSRFKKEALFGERALRSYVSFAIAELDVRKRQDPSLKNMSATLAAVLIDRQDQRALFAHLGDTRIYHFRDRDLLSVTHDHSLIQQFVDAGYCRPEQLRTHPQRSTLFAAVGINSESIIEALHAPLALRYGDALLMCTDGLWEWITETAMTTALLAASDARSWLKTMCMIANQAHRTSDKQRDNSSAIAVWCERAPTTP
jgi:serine/threonine protein phosphatase PrpC